jgi:hypothetical protein
MTQTRPAAGGVLQTHRDLVFMALAVAVVVLAMVGATALAGWHLALPSYELVPDPAGPLPF